jgi:SH3-like domain-containing protein
MTMRFRSWMRHHAIVMAMTIAVPGLALGGPGDALVVTGDAVNVRSGPTTSARILLRVNRREPAVELTREGAWVEVELPDQASRGWIHDSLLEPAPATAVSMPEPEPPASTPEAPVPAEPAAEASAPAATAPAAPAPAAPAERAAAAPAPTGSAAAGDTGTAATPRAAPATTSAAVAVGDSFALQRFQTTVDYLNDRAVAAAGIDLFEGIESGGAGDVRVNVTDAWALMPPSGRQSYLNTLFDRWVAATGTSGGQSLQIVAPDGKVVDERTAR